VTLPTQSLSNAAGQAPALSHSGSVRQNPALANTPSGRKLRQAAGEFESILLASLWKSMKGSFASSGDDSSDPAHDTLDGLGVQSMCAAVGKAGGLGLGKLILKHLEPMLSDSQNGTAYDSSKALHAPADIPSDRP
jgi:Rod binding domain-containing protein